MTFSWLDSELSVLALLSEANISRIIICQQVPEYFLEQKQNSLTKN